MSGTIEARGRNISVGYRRYALAAIMSVFTLNLLDRGVMGLLLQPIKEDLHLSDTQLGFLTGIAFALFYASFGVPMARWADRGNRVTLTSAAIALWGLTVMACIFVTNYSQLLIARMAAAIGESGCKPPTYSLVGDYFPGPVERVRAMSLYWLSGPLATLISPVAGAWLCALYGWRMTFFLIGIPGLLLAIVVKLTLPDVRSSAAGDENGETRTLPPVRDVFGMLWRRHSCRHLVIALVLLFSLGFEIDAWSAAYLMRSHAMGIREVGVGLGAAYGFGAGGGVLLGGYVASRWYGKDERAQLRMSSIALAFAAPCYVGFLLVPQKYGVLLMLTLVMIAMNLFVAPTYTLMQRLVPDETRATTMSVIMLMYNLIGMGVAPQVVGFLSDSLAPLLGPESLRYSMLSMTLIGLWSSYHFWQAGRSIKKDLSNVSIRGHALTDSVALTEALE